MTDDGMRSCPICGGTGTESIPIEDDWGGVEMWVKKTCGICGGDGKVDAIQFSEMEAEYGPHSRW